VKTALGPEDRPGREHAAGFFHGNLKSGALPPSRFRKSAKFGHLAILSAKQKGLKSVIEHLHVERARDSKRQDYVTTGLTATTDVVRMQNGSDGNEAGRGTAVITRTKTKTKKPSLYRVLILNDDYTPMEFVVHVLERFFQKDREAATRIMLHVHNHGVGECGVYTFEVAETKVSQVMDFARQNQHPLQCVMEKK
jgi:ATP-dependent Clp protease adaptor protein ClpS